MLLSTHLCLKPSTNHFETHTRKEYFSLKGETRYYAPDENGGLFRWADPHITAKLTKFPRALSPSPTCPIPLSLYLYFMFSMVLCHYIFSLQFHFTPPVVFSSLPRTSQVSTLWPFTFTTTVLCSSHKHTRMPGFIPLAPPFSFSCFTYTQATFPNSHIHNIYNTIQSFPFTGTHTISPLSSLSSSTPTSH